MSIQNLRRVWVKHLGKNSRYHLPVKYIVATINTAEESVRVIRADRVDFHPALYYAISNELRENGLDLDTVHVECLGGGFMAFDPGKRRFCLYGRSEAYGADPDRADTATLLQGVFPGFIEDEFRDTEE